MRKWFIWLLALSALAGIADTLLWLWGTRALDTGLDRYAAQLRGQGWTVEEGSRVTGGWPFAASLAVADLNLSGGEHALPGGLSWHAARVTLSVSVFAPFTLQVAPEGREVLRVSHMKPMVFDADRIDASVPLLGGALAGGDLEAEGMTGGLVGSHHPQDVRLESLSLHVRARPGEAGGLAGEISFAARQIELPDIGRWPLGATLTSAAGKVLLSSPSLPGGSASASGDAAAWRDGGGTVSLQDVSLRWGPLGLDGQARLSLDDRLQPAGSGTADVSGGAAAIDALVVGGVIQQGLGATAKAVLSVMAQVPGTDAVRLPFVLRDSTVSVGPIPLARLNEIVW